MIQTVVDLDPTVPHSAAPMNRKPKPRKNNMEELKLFLFGMPFVDLARLGLSVPPEEFYNLVDGHIAAELRKDSE